MESPGISGLAGLSILSEHKSAGGACSVPVLATAVARYAKQQAVAGTFKPTTGSSVVG